MKNLNRVIRIIMDERKNVILIGIYIDNKRYITGEYLDIQAISEKFNSFDWETDVIYLGDDELVFFNDNKNEYLPLTEDFLHLLDYTEINIGDTVYLFDTKNTVSHIEKGKRLKGIYEYYHWEEIDNKWYSAKIDNEYLEDHEIILFKVNGDDKLYIWDDYTYQQSFLYLKLQQYNKI